MGDERYEEFIGRAAEPQRFGGIWTLQKLEALEKYLGAYTTALKFQRFELLYVDAFAGSGTIQIEKGLARGQHRGSAQIAMATEPPFHRLIFIDDDANHCESLRCLADDRRDARVSVVEGDANEQLLQVCSSTNWRQTRGVLFLDPYGLKVEWSTLEVIAATEAIDVWYLFPLSGVYRQMALDPRDIDADKEAAITRILGTPSWRQDLYSPATNRDLFDEEREERHEVKQIQEFFAKRLSALFPKIEGPKTLRMSSTSVDAGAPFFDLYFAVSNPSPKARDLAAKMARGILDSL